jgi:chlorite dismutase
MAPTSPLSPLVLDGWFVLHQFFRISRVVDEEARDRAERAAGLADLLASWEDLGEGGWSGLYRMVGGESDLMAVHFRSTLDALGEAERSLRRADRGADLILTGDYLSVVEMGLYAVTAALLEQAREEGVEPRSEAWDEMVAQAMEQQRSSGYVRRRLQPRQPDDMPYICFYPMDKRRKPGQNWYVQPLEERARMMEEHGRTGRAWAGRISQIISGSIGFDDWEWAVTLFAADPLEFKALVTEMRYDEVSSVYADFGPFLVGRRLPTGSIAGELAGEG